MKELLLPILEKYGISIAVLVGIILWLTVAVNADLERIQGALGVVQREHYEMRFYLRGICLNAANGDANKLANCSYAEDRR